MPELANLIQTYPPAAVISTGSAAQPIGYYLQTITGNLNASAVWPSANLAIYTPVLVPEIVTVYKMSIQVATQNGNVDVGIYDEVGNRLVSAGSTAVGAAGLQVFDVTDTVIGPGVYYLAMCCSSTTASFFRNTVANAIGTTLGVKQQAVGAVTLPTPATFATFTVTYIPSLSAHLNATV